MFSPVYSLGSCVYERFQMVYSSVFDNLKDLLLVSWVWWWSIFTLNHLQLLQSFIITNVIIMLLVLCLKKSHDIISYLLSTYLRNLSIELKRQLKSWLDTTRTKYTLLQIIYSWFPSQTPSLSLCCLSFVWKITWHYWFIYLVQIWEKFPLN